MQLKFENQESKIRQTHVFYLSYFDFQLQIFNYLCMNAIKQLITDGKTDEAIRLLDEYIKKNTSSDEAYYLRGNAYRKKGDVRQALNNYLSAIEINPDSPAQIAHDALIHILNFYNKDMYNH